MYATVTISVHPLPGPVCPAQQGEAMIEKPWHVCAEGVSTGNLIDLLLWLDQLGIDMDKLNEPLPVSHPPSQMRQGQGSAL